MKYCEIKKLVGETRTGEWWKDINLEKKGKKWTTLYHNGMYFPEPYKPLPAKIKLLYKGEPVSLDSTNVKNPFNVSTEEAAVFFASMVDRDTRLADNKKRHRFSEDKVFRKNFWDDWKKILGKQHDIKSLDDVDFTPISKYLYKQSDKKKESKKSLTKEEKLEEKAGKESIKEIYGYAIVDGVKMEMEYNLEPPGLFQGHGKQPLRGKIKKRLIPSDITLNVSKDVVPKCYMFGEPCKWGKIVENNEVTWIASWRDPITNETKNRWLKRVESHFVCANDMVKFDKARKLHESIEKIRKKYTKDLSSEDTKTKQLATAVYLLDVLAIRPGTEKDEAKEAGTLGLTTLLCNNVKFEEDSEITIDFIGKSSIQFNKKFKIDSKVYKNLQKICKSTSKAKSKLFLDVNAKTLNDYLKTLLPDLSAKVFRTWKASSILQEELNKNKSDEDDPVHTKQLLYNKVNIEVAKALNHKKMSDSDERIKKLKDKIKELKKKKKEATTEKQKETAKKNLATQESKLEEAEQNISLGTSKMNYIDPRISIVWAKNNDVPIEKIYNKTLLKKFIWAMDAELEWQF